MTGRVARLLVGAAMLAGVGVASGADNDLVIELGGGYSDNPERVRDDLADEQGMATAALHWNYQLRDTSRLEGSVGLDVDAWEYMGDGADDEVLARINSTIRATLVPERLIWSLQESLGQQQRNTFGASGPGNREYVNYLTTGPLIVLARDQRNNATLRLTASDVRYEDLPNDNQRYAGALELQRALNRQTSATASLSTTTIEYDASQAADFKRHEGTVGLAFEGQKVMASASVGYTRVDGERSDSSGSIFDGTLTFLPSRISSVTVSGGVSYSDAGDIFRTNLESPFLQGTQDVVNSDNSFRLKRFGVDYSLERKRMDLRLSLGWAEEDYGTDDQFDRDRFDARLALSRQFTREVDGQAYLSFGSRDFSGVDRTDDDTGAGIVLSYRLGVRTSADLRWEWMERDSDVPGSDYSEHRVLVGLSYRPLAKAGG